jgi:DNA repair exonuclease SbcCD nuclease subunit
VYPGNLQGRHIREQGAKGCELVTVEDGSIITVPVALDVLRWSEIAIDVRGMPDLDALLDRVAAAVRTEVSKADGRIAGVRLRLHGAGAVHRAVSAKPEVIAEQFRAVALDASAGSAWVEKVDLRVRPPFEIDRVAAGDDPVALLVREIKALAHDQATLSSFANDALRELKQKLPSELSQDEELRLDAPEVLRELLRDAEGELLARLAAPKGAQ